MGFIPFGSFGSDYTRLFILHFDVYSRDFWTRIWIQAFRNENTSTSPALSLFTCSRCQNSSLPLIRWRLVVVDAKGRALIPVRHASVGRGADVSFHDLLIPGARVTSARDPYLCLFFIASQPVGTSTCFPASRFWVSIRYFVSSTRAATAFVRCCFSQL